MSSILPAVIREADLGLSIDDKENPEDEDLFKAKIDNSKAKTDHSKPKTDKSKAIDNRKANRSSGVGGGSWFTRKSK